MTTTTAADAETAWDDIWGAVLSGSERITYATIVHAADAGVAAGLAPCRAHALEALWDAEERLHRTIESSWLTAHTAPRDAKGESARNLVSIVWNDYHPMWETVTFEPDGLYGEDRHGRRAPLTARLAKLYREYGRESAPQ